MDHLSDFPLTFLQKKVKENPVIATATIVTGIACLVYVFNKSMSRTANEFDFDADFMSSEQQKEHQKHLNQILRIKKKEISKNKRSSMAIKKNKKHKNAIISNKAIEEKSINTSNIRIQNINDEEEKYASMSMNDNNSINSTSIENNNEYVPSNIVVNADPNYAADEFSSTSESAEPAFSANQYFGGVNVRPQYIQRQTTGPWKYLFDVYNQPQHQQYRHHTQQSYHNSQHSQHSQSMQSNEYIHESNINRNMNKEMENDSNDDVPMYQTSKVKKKYKINSLQYMREKYSKKTYAMHSPLQTTNIGLSFGANAEQAAIQNDLNEDNSILGGIKQMKEMISIERKQG